MLIQSIQSKCRYRGVKRSIYILLLVFVSQILPLNAICSMDQTQFATEISDHSGHMGHSIETVRSVAPSIAHADSGSACDCCGDSSCDMVSCNSLALTMATLVFSGTPQPAVIVNHSHQSHISPDNLPRFRPPIAS